MVEGHEGGGGRGSHGEEKWQVHYSRFFNLPGTPLPPPRSRQESGPHHPVPVHSSSRYRKTNPKGHWVSSSALASLSLSLLPGGPALSLHLGPLRRGMEEHYISKLVFSWPQTSCADRARGSRVVFASYRDGLGEVQKFAMRFLTAAESQRFISCLKVFFKDVSDAPTLLDFTQSNAISREQWPLSDQVMQYGCFEEPIEEPPSSNQGMDYCYYKEPIEEISSSKQGMEYCCSEEPTYTNVEEPTIPTPTLPTSFTNMLSASCTEQQNVALLDSPHDDKSTVQKPIYCEVPNVGDMTASSFFEMLYKLEEIIAEDGSTL